MTNISDVREVQVNNVLHFLGNLSSGYYNSLGIVSINLKDEQFKYFSYDIDKSQLFSSELYRAVLVALFTDFINKVKFDEAFQAKNLDRDSFFDYIDSFKIAGDLNSIDYDKIRNLVPSCANDKEVLINVYYILRMIQQSLYTNEYENYMHLFAEVNNFDVRNEMRIAIDSHDNAKEKNALLDEFIVASMVKYPEIEAKKNGAKGSDLIFSYVKHGYIRAVTNDNNLRDRVSNNLSRLDAYNIVCSSVIYDKTKSFDENLSNYITFVLFKDLFDSFKKSGFSREVFGDNFNQCMISGDPSYITRFGGINGKLERLLLSLTPNEVARFFNSIGVSSTWEYIDKYCINKDGLKKG